MKYIFFLLSIVLSSTFSIAQEPYAFPFRTSTELQAFLRYTAMPPTHIHAHRGGGYDGYPENCIETFDYTLKRVPAFMEIDPRLTKDSTIVLMHDATLDRTTNGHGRLSDYTYDQISLLRLKDKNGKLTDFKIPTLEEAFFWAKGKCVLIIDNKKDVPLSLILDMIKKMRVEANVILMAYTLEDAKLILADNPKLTLQVFTKDKVDFENLLRNNIPLSNVVAFVGHSYPENNEIFDLLHKHGVKAIVGTSRNVDIEYEEGNMSLYWKLWNEKVDIIEADSALNAGYAVSLFNFKN